MITEQKTLLANIRSLEADALKLLNSGVKIPGVHQRLRAAGNELQTRLSYLMEEKPAKKKPTAPKTPAPAPETSAES